MVTANGFLNRVVTQALSGFRVSPHAGGFVEFDRVTDAQFLRVVTRSIHASGLKEAHNGRDKTFAWDFFFVENFGIDLPHAVAIGVVGINQLGRVLDRDGKTGKTLQGGGISVGFGQP